MHGNDWVCVCVCVCVCVSVVIDRWRWWMETTGRRCPANTGTAFARACGAMRRMGCIFGGKWQTMPTFYARKTARRAWCAGGASCLLWRLSPFVDVATPPTPYTHAHACMIYNIVCVCVLVCVSVCLESSLAEVRDTFSSVTQRGACFSAFQPVVV